MYLSVTNKSNALSILKTRGPGFVMPPSSGFALLSDPEPDANELAAIVDATYERAEIVGMGENDPGVVFAGAGEPLLRLDVVVDTMAMVRESRHGVPFRIHSNGLHEPGVAAALASAMDFFSRGRYSCACVPVPVCACACVVVAREPSHGWWEGGVLMF